jgi:2-dehydro-3-deoxyphosphooctonate aldolase (KDO 8-P synthase)
MQDINVGNFFIGQKQPLTIICGPCVIESEEFTLRCASELQKIFQAFPFQFIFKASYDKANRSSIHSFRGPGIDQGLRILSKIQKEFDLPILTDVHTVEEAVLAGSICDMIQIPAFLCRQTDLIAAAACTNAAVNVKKGQFLAPWDMKNVVEKFKEAGQNRLLLTDRGTSFGYNNLVSDMRSIPIMQSFGYPVCFDATHSAQLPGGLGVATGGMREFIPTLAKAAIGAGANALFIEAHPHPASAKSDAATVMPYDALKTLLFQVERLYEAVQCFSVSSL